MASFLTQIGTVLTSAIGWIGSVVTSMFGENGQLADLLPFIALGIGVGVLGLGVRYIRSFIKIG